eukprot:GILI01014607.1.p1 GENE.GILI01014607.1~~GILI01014607.1.p1  ORF type:complete len:280 (+),score=90.18 GILI01014607.1:194-1033(+)
MDKSTNTHQKVAATFLSVYYNAITEGNISQVANMYVPGAKVNHWAIEGAAGSLKSYAKGATVTIAEMDPRLIDNTHLKVLVKGSITLAGEQKKDFQQDLELVHIGTSASQLTFGVASDFLRVVTALPPPPKMRFDDWAADTPPLNGQQGHDVVPDIEFQKVTKNATPKATPKAKPESPAVSPKAPSPRSRKSAALVPATILEPFPTKATIVLPATKKSEGLFGENERIYDRNTTRKLNDLAGFLVILVGTIYFTLCGIFLYRDSLGIALADGAVAKSGL